MKVIIGLLAISLAITFGSVQKLDSKMDELITKHNQLRVVSAKMATTLIRLREGGR